MAIYTYTTSDNEYYLYMNGKLIYKKWLCNGHSILFDKSAYTKSTCISITKEKNQIRRSRNIFINGHYCYSEEDFWDELNNQIGVGKSFGFPRNVEMYYDFLSKDLMGNQDDILIELTGTQKLIKIFGMVRFRWIVFLIASRNNIRFELKK